LAGLHLKAFNLKNMETKNNIEKEEKKDYGQVFFSWQFPEFASYQREKRWYIWGAIILVFFLGFSIYSANPLFALITVISALIILLVQRVNNNVNFEITEDGITLNDRFVPYKNIKDFYIIYNPPEVKTLYFEPKSWFNPRIPIPLFDQNPVKIREILRRYLDEDLERENEPTSDQFSRMFKL
jgi:hypothetical protein